MTLRDRRWKASEEADKLWERLSEGWRDLILELRSRPPLVVRDVEFVGPIASLTFAVSAITRPIGVQLVSLYRIDTGASSAVTFSWTYADGAVTTTAFAALPAATWRATFIVIGGS